MIALQNITRNLTASDFERIYFYCHRIRLFGQRHFSRFTSDLGAQVLPVIWSRKRSPGPLLCNVSEVTLVSDNFNGLAIHPRLIIGPNIRRIQLDVGDSFSCANVTAILRKAAPPHLSSFTLIESVHLRTLSWPETESLEFLLTLRGVRTLSLTAISLTSRAISIIAAFPTLEELWVSVTEQEMADYAPPVVGNSFSAITHLEISSETTNACQLLLTKIQSTTLQFLAVRRTAPADWDVERLFIALHTCSFASTLESLHVGSYFCIPFKIDARTFERFDSFKNLRDLEIVSTFIDLEDIDLLKLAKSLPRLHSLVFDEDWNPDSIPKCTFTGMQHVIQFCPKLERLTLCIDARQIPIYATQPEGEYPIGLHLATLNLRASPILNACDVASYLIMLLPVLTDFSTAYTCQAEEDDDDDEEEVYRTIWLEVMDLLHPITHSTHILDHKS